MAILIIRMLVKGHSHMRGCWDTGVPQPPILSLSVDLPHINSACQRCIADKTQRRYSLSANWGCAPHQQFSKASRPCVDVFVIFLLF